METTGRQTGRKGTLTGVKPVYQPETAIIFMVKYHIHALNILNGTDGAFKYSGELENGVVILGKQSSPVFQNCPNFFKDLRKLLKSMKRGIPDKVVKYIANERKARQIQEVYQ